MRRLPLLILLALAMTTTAATALTVEAPPEHAPGDRWVLEGTWTWDGNEADVTMTREVDGQVPVEIPSGTYDGLRANTLFLVEGQGGQEGEQMRTEGTEWVRLADGALLRAENQATAQVGQSETSTTETTYDEPCEQLRYPLAVGQAWTVTCTATQRSSDGSEQETTETTEVEVLREETVTVPAGTFQTLVLERTDEEGIVSTEWFAPVACGPVQRHMDSGPIRIEAQLTEFTCQAAALAGDGGPEQGGPDGQGINPLPSLGVAAVLGLLGTVALTRRRA